ncbi:MAG: DUF6431 domain-containing protein [Defluviitaleaceae bacterium]|nr:DUF6431 domain-containing protein [Defluviitaleaceae bacterium]MCL2835279.1 DUF6431 domain-containing protein [Defluviitaleaceae bacterium]
MIIISRYNLVKDPDSDVLHVRNLDAPLCPLCGSLCSGYDSRPRRVIVNDGNATVYLLRRVRCPVCKSLHREIPDFMRPRKHYAAAVIDDVLNGGGADCPADNATIWRWRKNHPPSLQ